MASKRRGPVLLELVKGRPVSPLPNDPLNPSPPKPQKTPQPLPATHTPDDGSGAAGSLISGRVLRVPAGYLFFAVAAVIAIFLIGWALGHRQAAAEHKREMAALAQRGALPSEDPLLAGGGLTAPLISATAPRSAAPAPASRLPRANTGQRPPAAGSPRETATLREGLNYLIVARADAENAEKARVFLRERGLNAVIRKENNRWHLVIINQAFPRGTTDEPEAQTLKSKVQRLGRMWKAERRGYTDFSDCYFKLWRAGD